MRPALIKERDRLIRQHNKNVAAASGEEDKFEDDVALMRKRDEAIKRLMG